LRGATLQGPLGAGLVSLLDEADGLLRRGVVSASYEWAIGGLPEESDLDEEAADWEVRALPDEEPSSAVRAREVRPRRRVKPYLAGRRARGGEGNRSKTVKAGARSAIKPRKRR
jgi:hypothetical protein